jgi:hypothetical protein
MGKEADILAKIVVVEDDVYMREELLNLLENRDMIRLDYRILKTQYQK